MKQALLPGVPYLPPGYTIEGPGDLPGMTIERPVYRCSSVVKALGCYANNFVHVFDETDTQIGTGVCGRRGYALITLDNPLSNESEVWAQQEVVNGVTPINCVTLQIRPAGSTSWPVTLPLYPKGLGDYTTEWNWNLLEALQQDRPEPHVLYAGGDPQNVNLSDFNFYYSNLQTQAHFKESESGPPIHTIQNVLGDDGGHKHLTIELPALLKNYSTIYVQVQVGTVFSNTFPLLLLDRVSPLAPISGTYQFPASAGGSMTLPCTANSDDPFAIDRVELSRGTGVFANRLYITAYLNGTPNSPRGLADITLNGGGGAFLHTESCRTVVTRGGVNMTDTINMYHWVDHTSSTQPRNKKLTNPTVVYATVLSKDGSVAIVVHNSSGQSSAKIYDLRTTQANPAQTGNTGCVTGCTSGHSFEIEHGRTVKVLYNGNVKVEATL